LRRFFQRFQQRVGRILIEIVGAVDDDDAPGGDGRPLQEMPQGANIVDGDALAAR
jgi:hypothetical protein